MTEHCSYLLDWEDKNSYNKAYGKLVCFYFYFNEKGKIINKANTV